MKLNIGDRVREIGRDCYKNEPIVIIDILYDWTNLTIKNRYHLRYLNVYNVQGTNMLFWVSEDEIVLDKEYYRDKSLKKIGI